MKARALTAVVVAAALLAPASAGAEAATARDLDPQIIGGTELDPAEPIEWLAAILTTDFGDGFLDQICTGALIAPDLVLTAAHCVEDGEQLEVAIGIMDLDAIGPSDRIPVIATRHPDRRCDNPTSPGDCSGNDLALLRLAVPATNTPVRIDPRFPHIGDVVTTYGWGATGWDYPSGMPTDYPTIAHTGAQVVTSDHANPSTCGFTVGVVEPAHQYCSNGATAHCFGDSGGPVVGPNTDPDTGGPLLVGVVSAGGQPCGSVLRPDDIDERVLDAIGWLEEMANEALRPCIFNPATAGEARYPGWTIGCWSPAADATPFVDLVDNGFYLDGIGWLFANGITRGTSPITFHPDEPVNRGQLATFLWRFADQPVAGTTSFPDVVPGAFYAVPVAWAAETGVTTGFTDGTFGPDGIVTRAQVITFLWRMVGSPESTTPTDFVDVPPSSFYADAVPWAVETAITNGVTPTEFRPDVAVTRGEVATLLLRFARWLQV